MDKIELKSEKEISATFHSPETNAEGSLEYYSVTISGRAMEATVQAESSPYGTNPADFFEQIAGEWQGWSGEKEWGAMEGEFSLEAMADSTGHIELTIKLQPNFYSPCWSAAVTLIIEAEQLEGIARKFKSFFYPASNK